MKKYYCFDCGELMLHVGKSLICSNATCGRMWSPSGYNSINEDYDGAEDDDNEDINDFNDHKYYDETDGYEDEMGYYNINGEMPPPGWGKKKNDDDDDY